MSHQNIVLVSGSCSLPYSGFPKELPKAAMHGNPEIHHRQELREPLVHIFHTHCWSQNCGSARFGRLENQDLLDYSSQTNWRKGKSFNDKVKYRSFRQLQVLIWKPPRKHGQEIHNWCSLDSARTDWLLHAMSLEGSQLVKDMFTHSQRNNMVDIVEAPLDREGTV